MRPGARRNSSEFKLAAQNAHAYIDANIHRALTEPSKAELQSMLAEAARNTAALSEQKVEGSSDGP